MLSQASAVDDQRGLAPPAATMLLQVVEAERESFSRRLLVSAIVVSCTLHVVGAAAMLSPNAAMPDYGVLSQQTDAISVEMTASTIIEAVEATASIATAAAAPTATQVGNPVPSSAAAVPMTKVEETAVETPVLETVKAAEAKPDVVVPLRAKVARNKPSGLGRRGEVQISFGVTPSGDLGYGNLAQSSGNTKLDEAAIDAVRRSAPFGPPPADAWPSQLRFSIPFYFR